MSIGKIIKQVLWWFLIASIALAVFRGAGSVNNIYPWLTVKSHQVQVWIGHLTDKVPTDHLKPLKPIWPNGFVPSPTPTATPTATP